MRWDNLAENTRETGTGALFAADAVTTRTFDTPNSGESPSMRSGPARS